MKKPKLTPLMSDELAARARVRKNGVPKHRNPPKPPENNTPINTDTLKELAEMRGFEFKESEECYVIKITDNFCLNVYYSWLVEIENLFRMKKMSLPKQYTTIQQLENLIDSLI